MSTLQPIGYQGKIKAIGVAGMLGPLGLGAVVVPPSNFSVSVSGTKDAWDFSISFIAASPAPSLGYRIEVSKNNGSFNTIFSGSSDTAYSHNAQTDGSYRFRVRSEDAQGNSAYVASATFYQQLFPVHAISLGVL